MWLKVWSSLFTRWKSCCNEWRLWRENRQLFHPRRSSLSGHCDDCQDDDLHHYQYHHHHHHRHRTGSALWSWAASAPRPWRCRSSLTSVSSSRILTSRWIWLSFSLLYTFQYVDFAKRGRESEFPTFRINVRYAITIIIMIITLQLPSFSTSSVKIPSLSSYSGLQLGRTGLQYDLSFLRWRRPAPWWQGALPKPYNNKINFSKKKFSILCCSFERSTIWLMERWGGTLP